MPALVLAIAWYGLAKAGMTQGRATGFVVPVIGVLTLAGQAVWFFSLLRLRRRLRKALGRLCLQCAYDLSGLGESGCCPECGRPFEVKADRARWRSFIAYDA